MMDFLSGVAVLTSAREEEKKNTRMRLGDLMPLWHAKITFRIEKASDAQMFIGHAEGIIQPSIRRLSADYFVVEHIGTESVNQGGKG